jgi:dihydroflavonol-4-reductase
LLVMPGADTGFSFVYVDDAAEGHVLAAEKGRVGQSYILGGDVMTAGDAMQVVARLAGVPAPLLLLGSDLFTLFRPLVKRLESLVLLPSPLGSEVLSTMGCTWWVTSAKAEQELGYTHRSIEEGMAEAVTWEVAQLHGQPTVSQATKLLAMTTALILSAILLRGRRKAT